MANQVFYQSNFVGPGSADSVVVQRNEAIADGGGARTAAVGAEDAFTFGVQEVSAAGGHEEWIDIESVSFGHAHVAFVQASLASALAQVPALPWFAPEIFQPILPGKDWFWPG